MLNTAGKGSLLSIPDHAGASLQIFYAYAFKTILWNSSRQSTSPSKRTKKQVGTFITSYPLRLRVLLRKPSFPPMKHRFSIPLPRYKGSRYPLSPFRSQQRFPLSNPPAALDSPRQLLLPRGYKGRGIFIFVSNECDDTRTLRTTPPSRVI